MADARPQAPAPSGLRRVTARRWRGLAGLASMALAAGVIPSALQVGASPAAAGPGLLYRLGVASAPPAAGGGVARGGAPDPAGVAGAVTLGRWSPGRVPGARWRSAGAGPGQNFGAMDDGAANPPARPDPGARYATGGGGGQPGLGGGGSGGGFVGGGTGGGGGGGVDPLTGPVSGGGGLVDFVTATDPRSPGPFLAGGGVDPPTPLVASLEVGGLDQTFVDGDSPKGRVEGSAPPSAPIERPPSLVRERPSLVGNEGGQPRLIAAPDAVPEPATWLMMLLGFAAAGTALRRRRALAAAAL